MTDHVEIIQADGEFDRPRAIELTRKATRALQNGHTDKAESLLQEAIVVDPSYGIAHNNLGLIYFERGDLYTAAWSFERAAEALPDRPDPVNNLGLVYEAAGRLDEAISQYTLAHDMQPLESEYLGNLVRARRRRGDLDPSVEEQLRQLVFIETRPEWREWAQDQLVLFLPKELERAAAEHESSDIELVPPSSTRESGPSVDEKHDREGDLSPPRPSAIPADSLPLPEENTGSPPTPKSLQGRVRDRVGD